MVVIIPRLNQLVGPMLAWLSQLVKPSGSAKLVKDDPAHHGEVVQRKRIPACSMSVRLLNELATAFQGNHPSDQGTKGQWESTFRVIVRHRDGVTDHPYDNWPSALQAHEPSTILAIGMKATSPHLQLEAFLNLEDTLLARHRSMLVATGRDVSAYKAVWGRAMEAFATRRSYWRSFMNTWVGWLLFYGIVAVTVSAFSYRMAWKLGVAPAQSFAAAVVAAVGVTVMSLALHIPESLWPRIVLSDYGRYSARRGAVAAVVVGVLAALVASVIWSLPDWLRSS